MYRYVLNSLVKISVIFAKYFKYYTIILGGGIFCGHAVYFPGLLSPNGSFPGAKFTLHRSLVLSSIDSVTVRHSSSRRQQNFATWYKEWNYGIFTPRHFQQRAPPILRGHPSRWATFYTVSQKIGYHPTTNDYI